MGAGYVEFSGAKNWIVGGAADPDSNVLIGPRVGIHVIESSDVRGAAELQPPPLLRRLEPG